MDNKIVAGDELKSCCKIEENLEVVTRTSDRLVQQCSVCGRRHFRVRIDPADFTARRKP